MNLPFELFFKDIKIGNVTSYSYETPWHSGNLEKYDSELILMLSNARIYLNYLDELEDLSLSEVEEDELCDQKFEELVLTQKHVEMVLSDDWKMKNSEGWEFEAYGLIFYPEGSVEWRGDAK